MDSEALAFELTKMLLASSLEFVRAAAQALQAVTGLLLTAYLAGIAAVGKAHSGLEISAWLAAMPAVLFTASLAVLYATTLLYRGGAFVFGALDQTLAAYEAVLKKRRRQVIAPALLTLAGAVVAAIVSLEIAT